MFLSEQPPRTLTRPSVTNMMPQRFPLLGRAFNETMFLGLDRGPWFYSPTAIYHFLWYSSLVSSSTPFLFSTMAPDVGIWNFKKSLVPELMKLEYCSATLSPYYPTLKPSVTHNTQPSIEQNKPTNTKPLKVSSPSPLPEHSLTLTLTLTYT